MYYINGAIENDPQNWIYDYELSLFIKRVYKLKSDAYLYMKKALTFHPQDTRVWLKAAILSEELCYYDEAIEYLRISL